MPSAMHLGDPLEGTRPDGDAEWWQRQIDQAPSDDVRRIVTHNRDVLQRFTDTFREHYFVSCWHIGDSDCMRMWDCYTSGSESVAVQTIYIHLKQSLPDFANIGLVRYIDFRTERLPTLNLFECVTHKDLPYQFENEARAVVQHPPPESPHYDEFVQDFFESESNPDFRAFAPQIDFSELTDTIVLHPDATPEFEEVMSKLCGENDIVTPNRSNLSRT